MNLNNWRGGVGKTGVGKTRKKHIHTHTRARASVPLHQLQTRAACLRRWIPSFTYRYRFIPPSSPTHTHTRTHNPSVPPCAHCALRAAQTYGVDDSLVAFKLLTPAPRHRGFRCLRACLLFACLHRDSDSSIAPSSNQGGPRISLFIYAPCGPDLPCEEINFPNIYPYRQ